MLLPYAVKQSRVFPYLLINRLFLWTPYITPWPPLLLGKRGQNVKTPTSRSARFTHRQRGLPGVQGVKMAPGDTEAPALQADRFVSRWAAAFFKPSFIKSPSLVDGNADAKQMRNVLHLFARSD